MADKFSLKAVISAQAPIINTLKQINAATRSTRKYIGDVGNSAANLAGKVGLPIGLISGALAGLSIAGVQRAVMGFAQFGDEVAKSSQRLGVSISEYQRLEYIAGQSGVSAEELGSSVGRLNRNIAMAAAGKGKDLAGLLKRAGISMRGANGELRSGAELLPEVADMFARNKNAAVQARMGNAIFGKSWQALAPLLQGGREGIEELTARYKLLGLEIDESAIKAGEKWGDQVDDLSRAVRAYGYHIAGKLLPVLSPLIERTIRWAAANRELITTRVSSFVAEFAGYVSRIDWNAVVQGANGLVRSVRDLVQYVGGARNALIGLVLVMNAGAIAATLGLAGSVIRLSWSIAAMAVTAIPGAVTGLSTMTLAMMSANAGGITMLGTVGLLAAKLAALAAVFAATYAAGKWMNENWLNPAVQKLLGDKNASLGTAMYDAFNKDPLADDTRPSIVTAGSKARVDGEVKISFANAPPGLRIEQNSRAGSMPLNLDVGQSSASMGLSY